MKQYPITHTHMADALAFIEQYWRERGCAPTFRAVAVAIGLKSSSHISKVIHRMRDEQKVEFKPKRHRTLKPFGWDAQRVVAESAGQENLPIPPVPPQESRGLAESVKGG